MLRRVVSRRKSHHPKRLFWTIVGLAILVVFALTVATAIWGSPLASGEAITLVKLQGSVVYPAGTTPTLETITLVRVDSIGNESIVTSNISLSQTDNAKIDAIPNRTFSVTGSDLPSLLVDSTYRFKLANGCYSEFKVPDALTLGNKSKIAGFDSKLTPDTNSDITHFLELGRIKSDCQTTPAPTPSTAPTATPTATATEITALPDIEAAAPAVNPKAIPFKSESCSEQTTKLDVIFVADASGSLEKSAAAGIMKQFVSRFVDQNVLNPNTDRANLISFSDPSDIRIEFTSNFSSISQRVKAFTFEGERSNIYPGIRLASDQLRTKRQNINTPVVVIVMSDGQSTMSPEDSSRAKILTEQDANLNLGRYFGISFPGRNGYLVNLAKSGQGGYFNVANSGQINSTVDALTSQINGLVEHCSNLEVGLSPNSLKVGQTIEATLTAKNNGRTSISNATITQNLPTGLQTEENQTSISITIPQIASGQSFSQKVTLKATE